MSAAATNRDPLVDFLLACADDKLLRGHLNSDWTGLAPILEEDIAFSSLAQDDMAHAQALYELAATRVGSSADQLAFGRGPEAFRSASIMEIPDDFDWAVALARQLYTSRFDLLRLERMCGSNDQELAHLAQRLRAEQRVHVEHADAWTIRLGRGSAEARERLQAALDKLAPSAAGLFEATEGQATVEAEGVYPELDRDMFMAWRDGLQHVLDDAGLSLDVEPVDPATRGGRRGVHDAALGGILEEMTEVFAIAPGSPW